MKYILILIVGFIALRLYLIKQAAERFVFAIGKASNIKIIGGSVQWTQGLLVSNGDNIAVTINGANLVNIINNREIGSCILLNRQTIPARSAQTQILFQVVVPLTDLVFLGLGVLDAIQNRKLTMTIKGYISSSGFDVPLNKTFTVQK